MGGSNIFLLLMVLWLPVDSQSPTGTSAIWISCQNCDVHTNGTYKWPCDNGCDKFVSNSAHGAHHHGAHGAHHGAHGAHRGAHGAHQFPISITKPTPASVTKPTPQSGTAESKKGSYLDCKKCFGHGRTTRDVRCKYGCGKFMTYPKGYIEDNRRDLTSLKTITDSPSQANMFNVKTLAKKQIRKTSSLRYEQLILLIGLVAGVTATIIGYIYFRQNRKPATVRTVTFASDNVVANVGAETQDV